VRVFILEGEGGFVSVVPVSDEEPLWVHDFLQAGDDGGVGDGPEAMELVIAVCGLEEGWGGLGLFEDGVDAVFGIGIEREDKSELGFRGAEQFEAVRAGGREGVLVGQDAVAEFFQAGEGDHACA